MEQRLCQCGCGQPIPAELLRFKRRKFINQEHRNRWNQEQRPLCRCGCGEHLPDLRTGGKGKVRQFFSREHFDHWLKVNAAKKKPCSCGCGQLVAHHKVYVNQWHKHDLHWRTLQEQGKKCNCCDEQKPITEFYTFVLKRGPKRGQMGVQPYCIECMKEKNKAWHNNTLRRFDQRLNRTMSRIRSITPDTDLTRELLAELWRKQDGRCWYTCEELIISGERWAQPHWKVENMASLDRLDPDRGYYLDNVVWASRIANVMKTNYKLERFLEVVGKIAERH